MTGEIHFILRRLESGDYAVDMPISKVLVKTPTNPEEIRVFVGSLDDCCDYMKELAGDGKVR